MREPLTAWTPTIAPAGLTYYDHPAIPGWRGSLLLATLKNQQLAQLPLDAAGDAITARPVFLTGLRAAAGHLRVAAKAGCTWAAATEAATGFSPSKTGHLSSRPPGQPMRLPLRLFPNPARRQATLRRPWPDARVTVRDLLGRAVLTLPERRPHRRAGPGGPAGR